MLLDEKMLPGIKIRIPQMEDLLQAEQAYLGVILEVAEWLRERMILLNEEVMNIPNLKAKIKQITGWDCEILEDAEHLTLTISYYFDAREPVLEQEERIMKYIPAHLKAVHEYLQRYAGKRKLYAGTTLGTYVRYIGRLQKRMGTGKGRPMSGYRECVHTYKNDCISGGKIRWQMNMQFRQQERLLSVRDSGC